MTSPNTGGDGVPNDHVLPPNKISYTRTECHSIELLDKEFPWKSLRFWQDTSLLSQMDNKVLFLKTTLTLLIEHMEVGLALSWSLHS